MDRYKITFDTWDKVANLYEDKFMDLALYNDSYDIFCRLINKHNAAIFEIGCGPGNITKYLVSARPDFRIVAIDVSPNMINLATINNPTADCRIMDCRNINTIIEKFDGIVCGFCIPYLSAKDTATLIKESARLLNKDGILYFSTIKGAYNQSGFEAGSTGDSAYVYYYNEDYFQKELDNNNFRLVDLLEKNFTKSDGTNQINQIFIAQKK
jgi:cyclopropane fatty-acyl-phospholipid synthase-like methyltransferase